MDDGNPRKRKRTEQPEDSHDVLGNLLGEVKEHNALRHVGREVQRHRTNIDEAAMVEDINAILQKYVTTPEEGSMMEVEARIGKIQGRSFETGLSEADWKSLETFLTGSNFQNEFEVKKEETVDYFYEIQSEEDPPEVSKFRLTCRPDRNGELHPDAPPGAIPIEECVAAVTKRPKIKEEFKGIAGRWNPLYDVRLSVVEEVGYDAPPTDDFPWHVIKPEWREKNRTSFYPKDKNNRYWRIDMTETTNEIKEKRWEVEFELKEGFAQELSAGAEEDNKEKRNALCEAIVKDLIHMVSLLFDRRHAIQAFTSHIKKVQTTRVSDASRLREMQLECLRAIPNQENADPSRIGFPGTMPVSFGKRHFSLIQNHDYYVSEKADGTRYFLYINQGGVFLVDRKFDFFEVMGYEPLTKIFERKTILDGEIVYDERSNDPKYIVFDIIELNGERTGDLDTHERLKKIGEFISVVREKIQQPVPFDLLGKLFIPKSKIQEVFNSIDNGVYRSGDKRFYKCDGILFTPVKGPYKVKGNEMILKWKFLERQSIDFHVEFGFKNDCLQLYCEGDGNNRSLCRRIHLTEETKQTYAELLNHMSRRPPGQQHQPNIVEFTFDTHDGSWKYCCLRTDKNRANHTSVACDTLEAIAQNITKEELIYRTQRPTQHDDWDDRLRAFYESSVRPSRSHRPPQPHHPRPHSHSHSHSHSHPHSHPHH
uniref:mRNA guanylyltransferase n=1 Tax=Paramoeba aestuarina TaxID=180227 RepID=A0A7S4PB78_9EUKA